MSTKTLLPPLRWRVTRLLMVSFLSACMVVAGCGGGGHKKSTNPIPALATVSPAAALAGGAGFTLTATGSGFVTGSTVYWNGAARTTAYASGTQLTATIPASDIATAGTAQVTVVSPTPGGGTSSPLAFTIGNPAPNVSSLSPARVPAGNSAFELTVNGSAFVTGATVQWNGALRATTFVSGTVLKAAISAADVASAGTAQVTVTNPSPGGGTSPPLALVIEPVAPVVPVITALDPPRVVAGVPAFDLVVTGTGFVTGATVQWNGAVRATTFVSGTSLRATISAADVASAGTAQVTVVNPGPGGGTSAPVAFVIAPVAPAPVITALEPSGVVAGAPAFDLFVTGTGFVTGATVKWNGADRTTTFLSTTQVKAAIMAADVANPMSVPVTVTNPGAGGGTSNSLNFIVRAAGMVGRLVPVTVAPDGSPPNGPSLNGGLSFLGRHGIFASKASNLVPGDTNGAWDVFVRDTCIDYWTDAPIAGCTPTTTRISVAPDGSQANGDSGSTAASPDGPVAVSFGGRYVAFISSATNLVAGDTNGVDDVFLADTCRDDRWGAVAGCSPGLVRVSLRNDGSQSNLPASAPALGDGGGHVVFVSADPAMVSGDGNGLADVFLRDVCPSPGSGCTPGTRRISVAPGNADANAASGSPSFTGRYVAFTSAATNLVPGDTNGLIDVFMRDTCIGAEASCMPATERISVGNGNVQADGASSEPLVTLPMSGMDGYDYHGRFVVFVSSAANLVAGDTNGVADVFQRDTCRGYPGCTPSTQRISLTSTGQQIVGQPSMQPGHMRWDGGSIIFATAADGVVPEDTNGVADVYVNGVRVSVGTSGLQGNAPSVQPRGNYDAWAGPEWATFFSTASNFWPGGAPSPYYGAIFRAPAY